MIKYLSIDEVVLITESKIRGSMFETLGAKQFLDRFISKGQLKPVYYFDGFAVLHHHAPLDFKGVVIKNIWRIEGYFKDDHSLFVENAKVFKRPISVRDSAFKGLSNSIFKLNQNAGYIHEIVASRFVGDDETHEIVEKANLEHGRSYEKSHAILFNEKPLFERAYEYEDIKETILIDRDNVFFAIEDINNIFEQLPANTEQHTTAAPYKEGMKKADDKSKLAPNELGEYQKLLITYELFTPEKIACLLTDSNPAYNHNNDDYNARLDMVSNAIDAGKLTYVNSKDEISAEQIKIWLKNNKIVFEGFNDDSSLEQSIQVNELQKRIDELENQLSKFQTAAPDVVSIPFGKRIDLINKDLPQDERLKESYQIYSNDFSFHEDKHPVNTPDEMIKRIQGLLTVIKRKDSKILELEKQTNAPANAQAEIDELNKQLSTVKKELAAAKNTTTAQPIDWQSIGKDERVYPPELHLALMIWQRIYLDNELKDTYHISHNSKFQVIAKDMNLKPKTALYERVRMVINTAYSKSKQAPLADPLRAIEQLYMPPKKEKTTS